MNNQLIRLLLIEDNPNDVRLLRASLTRIEQPYFDLECADHLATGLARLATREHDVVLLDLTLPDSVGFATFAAIRGQAPNVPIVILTGLDDKELAVRAVHEGAQDYLLKDDLDGRLLTRVIRYAIERNQAELALRAARDELERRVEERTAALAEANLALQAEIAERKQTEETLRVAQQLVDKVFASQNDAIFVIEPSTRTIIACNPAVARVFGYDVSEVVGRNTEFLHVNQATYADFGQRLFVVLDAEGVFQTEFQMRRKDGSIFLTEHTITQIVDDLGRRTSVVSIVRDITERKRAEQALRVSEGRLALIVETVPNGITIVERSGQITFANRAAERILGLTRGGIAGRVYNDPVWKITATDGAPFPEDELPFVRVMRTGEPVSGIEHAIEHPDGARVMLSVNATPLRDAAGNLMGMVAALTDITERTHTEAALRKSEERYRLLFEQMLEGSAHHEIICDENGKPVDYRFLQVNPAFEKLTGLRAQDIIGKTVREVLPNTEPYWIDVYGQVALSGRPVQFDNYSQAVGRYYHVTAFSTERGQFAVTFEDITERKRAEEEIQNLARFPSENPGPILRIGRDGTLLYINQAGLSLLPEWHLQRGQAAPPLLREAALQVIDDGSAQVLDLGHRQRVYSFFVAPVVGAGYVNLYGRDVTERRQTEEMIRAANEQLRRLAQQVITAQEDERRRLSRELHDEAGQALTALKINLELVRADLPAGADALGQRLEDAVALTGATMEQLRGLAQDLRPPALDAVGLGPALDDLCRGFARRTGLRVAYAGAELPALPDAVNISLYRFLQEALTNVARHASARQVDVTLQSDAETVSLTVADDGKGFERAAATSPSQPAGLGLLGMRERIELVGGRLQVESTPGRGARLTAHIPRGEET
ncbi:MAG: PAS domain S-box protein [Chloroflexi bacterium]|nr:PAS domain S-box protein [Chloroflexota bacterium]